MVQLMKNDKSESKKRKMAPVKMEVEDDLNEEHAPLHKRQKQVLGMRGFTVPPASQYNPLHEPSPLGLRLRKSPSLLELIQMKLSQPSTSKIGSHNHDKKETKDGVFSIDKLKASNFPASILKIGTWEYKSRYEGDLVAKCYYAKHKLVWEVLDGGLKNKIEIQWADIMALKANYPDDGPGTLTVVLSRRPLFFRETNPQPRKHTLWQATSDFTGGQASLHRQHYLECPQGLLGKHFEKLNQCDPRLNFLSQQGEITLDSPHFEPRIFDDPDEKNNEFYPNREESPSFFSFPGATSPSGAQSDSYHRETPSPTSAKSTLKVVDIENGGIEQLKALSNWDQITVPGLRSSMSMSDLVSHLENRISEQGKSNGPNLSNEEWESLQILDEINRCLFSDSPIMPDSDEKSLMSRVNSLCCLLQKDKSEYYPESNNFGASSSKNKVEENYGVLNEESGDVSGNNISRNDSVGDFLLNLPRIASLPQFLFNISEYQAR